MPVNCLEGVMVLNKMLPLAISRVMMHVIILFISQQNTCMCFNCYKIEVSNRFKGRNLRRISFFKFNDWVTTLCRTYRIEILFKYESRNKSKTRIISFYNENLRNAKFNNFNTDWSFKFDFYWFLQLLSVLCHV